VGKPGAVALLTATLALSLLAAGCGSGDGNSTGTGKSAGNGSGNSDGTASGSTAAPTGAANPAIAKAAFIEQANAICTENKERTTARLEDAYAVQRPGMVESPRSLEETEVSVIVPILVTGVEAEAGEIRALGVPSGYKDQLSEVLGAFQAWIDEAQSNPRKVVRSNDVYNEARKLARDNGLADCGKSPFG
jgi:hypothetical protein